MVLLNQEYYVVKDLDRTPMAKEWKMQGKLLTAANAKTDVEMRSW